MRLIATCFSKPSSPAARPRNISAIPPIAIRSKSWYWPNFDITRPWREPGTFTGMAAGGAHIRTILATAVQDGVVPGIVVLASAAGQIRLCEIAGHAQIEPSSHPTHRHTV